MKFIKNIKTGQFLRCFTCFLVITLMTAVFPGNSARGAAAALSEDAFTLLEKLDILTDSDKKVDAADEPVSRGYFARLVIRALGAAGAAETMKTRTFFTDVDASTENAGYINAAVELGLVNGTGYGMFRPSDPVTSEMALKVMLSALGYNTQADSKGGYPSGYAAVASGKGLLSDLSPRDLTYGETVNAIFNMLETAYLNPVAFSNGEISYYSGKNNNILSDIHNVYKADGIVTANLYTGIDNPLKNTTAGRLEIANEMYLCQIPGAEEFLGCNVRFYYRAPNDGEKEALTVRQYKTDSIEIQAKDIVEFKAAGYDYRKSSDKTVTARLSSSYDLIYNNTASVTPYSIDKYVPPSGCIRLIDNNGDGVYDVLKVYSYTNRIIRSVNQNNQTLVFRNDEGSGAIQTLDLKGKNYILKTLTDGESDFSKLKVNDVLSMLLPENGDSVSAFYFIYAGVSQFDGKVSGTTAEDGIMKITVTVKDGEKEYAVDRAEKNLYKVRGISPGESGIFFVSMFGDIIGFIKGAAQDGDKTGFLISAAAGKGLNAGLRARILESEGLITDFDCVSNFTFSYPNSDAPWERVTEKSMNPADIMTRVFNNGTSVREPVIYRTDSDGQITRLTLPVKALTYMEVGDENVKEDRLLTGDGFHELTNGVKSMRYVQNSRAFATGVAKKKTGEIILMPNTVTHFDIAKTHGEFPDDQSYVVGTGSWANDTAYQVRLFAVESESQIAAVTVVEKDFSTGTGALIYAVDSIGEAAVGGDTLIKLNVYGPGGAKSSIYTDDPKTVEGIGAGDIVQAVVNTKNRITYIYSPIHYNRDTRSVDTYTYWGTKTAPSAIAGETTNYRSSYGTETRYLAGAAYEISDNRLFITQASEIDGKKTDVEVVQLTGFRAYMVFESNTGKWRTGSYTDVYDYINNGKSRCSFVFARMRYAEGQEMFIYN